MRRSYHRLSFSSYLRLSFNLSFPFTLLSMFSFSARPLRLLWLLASGLCLLAASARADLVWTAQTGWRIEGGALSGLTGDQGRNALDLMNKAREAEEKKSLSRAARMYEKVAKKYPNSVYAPEAYFRAGLARGT